MSPPKGDRFKKRFEDKLQSGGDKLLTYSGIIIDLTNEKYQLLKNSERIVNLEGSYGNYYLLTDHGDIYYYIHNGVTKIDISEKIIALVGNRALSEDGVLYSLNDEVAKIVPKKINWIFRGGYYAFSDESINKLTWPSHPVIHLSAWTNYLIDDKLQMFDITDQSMHDSVYPNLKNKLQTETFTSYNHIQYLLIRTLK
jgi:hypothetical protein